VALREQIPALTRSNLRRCLQRNGLSRFPEAGDRDAKAGKAKFADYAIGYVHTDISQITTAEGKAYFYVAVERKNAMLTRSSLRKWI
jgi:hypothetical protein